jgi:hypothetical protein
MPITGWQKGNTVSYAAHFGSVLNIDTQFPLRRKQQMLLDAVSRPPPNSPHLPITAPHIQYYELKGGIATVE